MDLDLARVCLDCGQFGRAGKERGLRVWVAMKVRYELRGCDPRGRGRRRTVLYAAYCSRTVHGRVAFTVVMPQLRTFRIIDLF